MLERLSYPMIQALVRRETGEQPYEHEPVSQLAARLDRSRCAVADFGSEYVSAVEPSCFHHAQQGGHTS